MNFNSKVFGIGKKSVTPRMHRKKTTTFSLKLLCLWFNSYLWIVFQVLVVQQGMVGPEHNPVEQCTVQRLCHGIPNGARLNTNANARQFRPNQKHMGSFILRAGATEPIGGVISYSALTILLSLICCCAESKEHQGNTYATSKTFIYLSCFHGVTLEDGFTVTNRNTWQLR